MSYPPEADMCPEEWIPHKMRTEEEAEMLAEFLWQVMNEKLEKGDKIL